MFLHYTEICLNVGLLKFILLYSYSEMKHFGSVDQSSSLTSPYRARLFLLLLLQMSALFSALLIVRLGLIYIRHRPVPLKWLKQCTLSWHAPTDKPNLTEQTDKYCDAKPIWILHFASNKVPAKKDPLERITSCSFHRIFEPWLASLSSNYLSFYSR